MSCRYPDVTGNREECEPARLRANVLTFVFLTKHRPRINEVDDEDAGFTSSQADSPIQHTYRSLDKFARGSRVLKVVDQRILLTAAGLGALASVTAASERASTASIAASSAPNCRGSGLPLPLPRLLPKLLERAPWRALIRETILGVRPHRFYEQPIRKLNGCIAIA